MNITCSVTDGMTIQEKEIYFAHMEMRHREEKEKIDHERKRIREYKQSLIDDAMKTGRYTRGYLEKQSIRSLERIF